MKKVKRKPINKPFYLTWDLPFSPSNDFVPLVYRSGRMTFKTKKERDNYASRLHKATIQVGPHDGESFSGYELMVRTGHVIR